MSKTNSIAISIGKKSKSLSKKKGPLKSKSSQNPQWSLSQTLKDVFEEGLKKIHDLEQQPVKNLSEMAQVHFTDNEDWKDAFIEPLRQIKRTESTEEEYSPAYA
jgi:hypothetical protein